MFEHLKSFDTSQNCLQSTYIHIYYWYNACQILFIQMLILQIYVFSTGPHYFCFPLFSFFQVNIGFEIIKLLKSKFEANQKNIYF